MAQQTVNNGDSGLTARNSINDNFTELYNTLSAPIKLTGLAGNFSQAIAANSMVTGIAVAPVSGGPITLRIGITANGQEILADTVINGLQPVTPQQYFSGAGTLYFTFTSGAGTLNVRIDVINNYN